MAIQLLFLSISYNEYSFFYYQIFIIMKNLIEGYLIFNIQPSFFLLDSGNHLNQRLFAAPLQRMSILMTLMF